MEIWKKIIYFIFAFLHVIILLAKLCMSLPFYTYRYIISSICKFWCPNLRKIISSNYYMDKDGSLLVSFNLLISLRVQGIVNIEHFIQTFLDQCIYASNQNGVLEFPEFQEKIVIYKGYPFWAKDTDFNIHNHILQENCVNLDDELKSFESENILLETPFEVGYRSPWVVLISLDHMNQLTRILFKCHHSLGDGVSLYNSLMRMADNMIPIQSPPNLSQLSCLKRLRYHFGLPIIGIRDFMEHPPVSPFLVIKGRTTKNRNFVLLPRRSCQILKYLKSKYKISFTAVLLSALCGALKEYLIKINLIVPKYQLCALPMRLQSHNSGLCNQVRFALIKLPTGTENLIERLDLCQESLNDSARSSFSTFVALSRFIDNGYPLPLKNSPSSFPIVISSFPGPKNTMTVCGGLEVKSMHFSCQVQHLYGIHLTTLTYNDGISIQMSADQNVFEQYENARIFMDSLEQQMRDIELIPIPTD